MVSTESAGVGGGGSREADLEPQETKLIKAKVSNSWKKTFMTRSINLLALYLGA
jgi:hypothetical protein